MTTRYWANLSGGQWSAAANWLTAIVPAATDDASITGPTDPSTQIITGPGVAASMAFLGNTTLEGAFATSRLSVGDATNGATLTLDAAATLAIAGALTLSGGAYGSDLLVVTAGAAVQAGSVVLTPGGSNSITVDATATLEAGAAGGVARGTLAVDAGATLGGAGLIAAVNGIVDQGIILAQGGTLVIASAVTGAGQLQIGAGARLSLSSNRAASTTAIAFTGPGTTLAFGSYLSIAGGVIASGFDPQGVISGFGAGDTLAYAGADASRVVYAAGSGTLTIGTLATGSVFAPLGVLSLAGDYTGYSFLVTPTAGVGFNVVLVPVLTGGGTVAAAGTATADAYAWSAAGSGNWASAANWADAGAAAAVAPGVHNLVTITGGSGTQYIRVNGPGNASSLSLLGNTDLTGAFTTGALTIGTAAGVILDAGASLTAATATIDHATLQANGARLGVAGLLTLGDAASLVGGTPTALRAVGGATVQAGGITLLGAAVNAIVVDAVSSIEIGTTGGAAPGTLTIDAGFTLSGAAPGGIAATNGVVNNGTIIAQGGLLALGAVSGAGQLQVAPGSTLSLNGASSNAVVFNGAGGTLALATSFATQNGALVSVLTQRGTVDGFAPGDTITVLGGATGNATLTAARYQASGNGVGVLTLLNGAAVVGALTLAGQYGGAAFTVANGAASTAITVSAADPLFDPVYYRAHNPDVAAAGVDPYSHYMTVGWKEGRNPDAWFDTRYYLARNPDVAAAGVNPLAHFETNGWREGRQPSLVFSGSAYLATNPDVAAAGIDPLLHYIANGQSEGRAVSLTGFDGRLAAADPMVDAAYLDAQLGATLIPAGAAAQAQAAETYAATGWKQGLNPNAWFDTNYYLRQNPDVAAAGVNPLTHFETTGWKEGRAPSLVFDDAKYLAQYPDIAAAGIDPLLHYIVNGQFEGRLTFLPGGARPADPLVNTAYYDRQLGATLIPTGPAGAQQAAYSYDTTGWQRGLNPDAFFDTTYYLSHNPDVAAAHIDPLLHYENNGWHEGRDPSAQFSTTKYLAAYGDVKAAGIDPLLHYIQNGQAEGRTAFAV